MPGVKIGPYYIHFYEYDLIERPHIHVQRENRQTKFWLTPTIELYRNQGFAQHELGKIERLLSKNRTRLLRMWEEETKKR